MKSETCEYIETIPILYTKRSTTKPCTSKAIAVLTKDGEEKQYCFKHYALLSNQIMCDNPKN